MAKGLGFIVTAEDREFLNALRRDGQAVGQFSKQVEQSGVDIDATFRRLASSAGLVFGAAQVKELISNIARVRGEFQQLEIAFTTMLGSEESATSLMNQLVETAAKTPFDLKSISQGAKQLLAYGTGAEKVNETLIRLGNIASGLSIPLNDLVYLYGTTQTQGRLFTQDVRQFMGRGIPIVRELATELGKTEQEINDMVSSAKIGFSDVEKAIQNMTDGGGMFFKLMEKQSTSITGQISNLGDAWDMMLNNLGKNSEGVISESISVVSSLIENYEQIGRILIGLVSTYGAYRAALIILTGVEKGYTIAQIANYKALLLAEKAQKLLNATMLSNPYVLATTAIVGISTAIYAYVNAVDSAKKASEEFGTELDGINNKSDDRKNKVNDLISVIKDETSTESQRQKAMMDLQKLYPSIFSNLDVEKLKTMDLVEVKKELNRIESERTKQNLQNQVGEIDKEIEKLNKLKAATDNWKSGLAGAGLNVLIPGIGSAKQWYDNSKAVDVLSEKQRLYNEELKQTAEAEKRAEFDAKPKQEQLNILNDQLNALRKEQDELDKIILASQGASNAWGQFSGQIELSKIRLIDVQNRIADISSQITNTNEEPIVPVQNKAYWENQKDDAENALAMMDDALKGTEKWNEQLVLLREAQTKLTTWNFSKKSVEKEQKTIEDRIKAEKEFANSIEEIQNYIEEQKVSILKDGSEKRKAILDMELKRELDSINNMRDKVIEAYNEKNNLTGKKAITELDYKNIIPGLEDAVLNAQSHALANRVNNQIKSEKEVAKAIQEIRNELDSRFRTDLDNQILEINGYYKNLIESAKEYGINIEAEAEKRRKRSIEIAKNEAKLRANDLNSSLEISAFEVDTSSLGMTEYVERKKTEILLKYANERIEILKNNGDEQSQAELQQLKIAISGYEKVLSKPKSIKGILDEGALNKVKSYFRSIRKEGESIADADEKALKFFESFKTGGQLASDALNLIKGAAGGLSEDLDMALNAATDIAEGFATGGLVGGIEAAASQLIGITTKLLIARRELSEGTIRTYESYINILDRLIDRQIESIQIISGSTISESVSKATNDLYKQIEASQTMLSKFLDTGGGVFSHSYGYREEKYLENYKDQLASIGIYTTDLTQMTADQLVLLMQIPELWAGLFDDTKKYIEAIADSQDKIEELNEQVQDMVLNTAINLDGITNAIIDSFTDPEIDDALGTFEDKIDAMIGDVIKNIITKNMLVNPIQDMIEGLWNSVVIEPGKDISFEPEAIEKFKQSIMGQAGLFESAWKEWESIFNELGIDITGMKNQLEEERTGISGEGIAKASQDSINELSGRTLASNILLTEIRDLQRTNSIAFIPIQDGISKIVSNTGETNGSMFSLLNIAQDQLAVLNRIEANTALITRVKEGIDSINNQGVKIKM